MARGTHKSNLAASMGRWSAAHWKVATFGWLAFVVVAFAIGGAVGTKDADPNTTGPGQSSRFSWPMSLASGPRASRRLRTWAA